MASFVNIIKQTRYAGIDVAIHRNPATGSYVVVATVQGREVHRKVYGTIQEAILGSARIGRYIR